MSRFLTAFRTAGAAIVVAGGVLIASCAGPVSTTPAAQATSAPQSQTVPTAGGTLSIASTTAQTASITFSAGAPSNVTLSATSSSTAPSGAPAPSALKRTAAAIAGAVPFFYVTFSVSADFSTQYISSEAVTLLSSQPANASYYVEFDDVTSAPATKLGSLGPATLANSVATFVSGATANNSVTLSAGHTYVMQFYYIPAGTPTPTPSPTSTATGIPPGSGASPTPTPIPSYTFATDSDTSSGTATGMTAPIVLAQPTPNDIFTISFGSASNAYNISGALASSTGAIAPAGFPTPPAAASSVLGYVWLSTDVATTFAQTPGVQVSYPQGLPATTCGYYVYQGNGQGTGNAWQQVASNVSRSSSTSVTFPAATLPGNSTVQLSSVRTYIAVTCP